ncbi:MAG: FimB/Mfa2 family fimbrial subunit [Bacteroidales bacterium]
MNQLLVCTFLLLFFSLGCTEENLDKCIQGVNINYYYTYNKYDNNRFDKEVHRLSVFVFDSNDKLFRIFEETDSALLHNQNLINLPLPAGDWSILSWGGYMDHYQFGSMGSKRTQISDPVIGTTSLSDFCLSLDVQKSDTDSDFEMIDFITNLYYGEVIKVTTYPDQVVSGRVSMMKNTNDLIVEIRGIPEIESIDPKEFNVYVLMNNHRYDAWNSNQYEHEQLLYTQDCIIENGLLKNKQRVLKLNTTDDQSVLCIESKHLPSGIIRIPLLKMILANPSYNIQYDLDIEDEYIFELKLNEDHSISITFNDWEYIDVLPEM